MKKNATYTYNLSLDDVKEAIVDYMKKNGEDISGDDIKLDNIERSEEIPLLYNDCDYVYHFDGIKVTVNETI